MEHQGHWEWRGFGGASPDFLNLFSELPLFSESSVVEDFYLWAPGLSVNTKIRSGAESGLKFKRFINVDANLEKWLEHPSEIFEFPLSKSAWEILVDTFKEVGIALPGYPNGRLTPQNTLDILVEAGVKKIKVEKERETRVWSGPFGEVEIEWASISSPQTIISIGVENRQGLGSAESLGDEQYKKNVQAALETFNLRAEPLHVINYMDAIEVWAKDKKI